MPSWIKVRYGFFLLLIIDIIIFSLSTYSSKDFNFILNSTFITNLFFLIEWIFISYILGRYSKIKAKNKKYITLYIDIPLKAIISILVLYFSALIYDNRLDFHSYFILGFSSLIFHIIYFSITGKNANTPKKIIIFGSDEMILNIRKWTNEIDSNFQYIFYKGIDEIKGSPVDVIIAKDNIDSFSDSNLFYKLLLEGYTFKTPDQWFAEEFQRIPSQALKENYIFSTEIGYLKSEFIRRIKRSIDIVISLQILILTLPIILFSSLMIFLEDKGPILYSQERTGYRGLVFRVWKLRTMYVGAETGKAKWAKRNDNRITKIGSILRKTRIDELPQLVSVISGKMSLIGPRPERPELEKGIISKYPNYRLRYSVPPGLSGWAQVNFPYGASIEDSEKKLSYDIYYIKYFSLWLDFLIVIKTIKLILNAQGSLPNK